MSNSHNREKEVGFGNRFADRNFVRKAGTVVATGVTAIGMLAGGGAEAQAYEVEGDGSQHPEQAQVAPAEQLYTSEVVGETVNLRSAPDTSGEHLGTLTDGATLEVSKIDDSNDDYIWVRVWSYTTTNEQTGITETVRFKESDSAVYAAVRNTDNSLILLSEPVVAPETFEDAEPDLIPEPAPESPIGTQTPNPNETESAPSTLIFETPTEWSQELQDFVDARTPAEIRDNPEWQFDAQGMTYYRIAESGQRVNYRYYMGNTVEEDLVFGQHFTERDAFRVYNENGEIVSNISIELSGTDPVLENISIDTAAIESRYGMTEEQYAQALQEVLYKNFPFLEEEGITDIRVVFRTGATYTREGGNEIRPDLGQTSDARILDVGVMSIDVIEGSHTAVVRIAMDQSINANAVENGGSYVLGGVVMAMLFEQHALDNNGDYLANPVPDYWNTIGQLAEIGGNSQYGGDQAAGSISELFTVQGRTSIAQSNE